jgi:hypothetical protein
MDLPATRCFTWLLQGAIRQFTKGLAQMITPSRGIRVNAVAPGPIWCAAVATAHSCLFLAFLCCWTATLLWCGVRWHVARDAPGNPHSSRLKPCAPCPSRACSICFEPTCRTPIQPSSFSEEAVEELGAGTPIKGAGQPKEVGTCIVFLGEAPESPLYAYKLTGQEVRVLGSPRRSAPALYFWVGAPVFGTHRCNLCRFHQCSVAVHHMAATVLYSQAFLSGMEGVPDCCSKAPGSCGCLEDIRIRDRTAMLPVIDGLTALHVLPAATKDSSYVNGEVLTVTGGDPAAS